jgi:hypothetical protein
MDVTGREAGDRAWMKRGDTRGSLALGQGLRGKASFLVCGVRDCTRG